ncbi:MAG: hypothetical protein ACHQAY_07530 [Hyphomicrobiales bacterium]
MTPERLGAFWPSPLSFSRSLLRDLARQGCRVTRREFGLDAEGEGCAIYDVAIGDKPFTFYVLSFSVPEEEKTDRVIGVKWDVMAALMAGRPSPERLAALRRELPKQKVGRADQDTLVWLRANKSVRAFRHTVAHLAKGDQPDPRVLLSTGYLLRTTAFYANGKLGTIAFRGLRQLGALFEPYHAQIMSAWLLREFAFDLVEHLAKATGAQAASLSPQARRMSGVGNSAGVGIVPFALRHPAIIDRWVRAYEHLLSQVREQAVHEDGIQLAMFMDLLARAERYYGTLPEQSGAFFAAPDLISAELLEVGAALRGFIDQPRRFGAALTWSRLCDWASEHVCAETQEVLNVTLMELYPELVEAAQPQLTVEEEYGVKPGMTLGQLAGLLRDNFAWVAGVLAKDDRRDVFWYRSDEAGEPRIAERGDVDWSRREVFMDLALQIDELREAVARSSLETEVADFLLQRPDLYEAIRRVQANLRYGEVRANLVDGRLAPLPLIRFVLAFYGMERFTPGSTRWVRGTFLQGAPTASDLEQGLDGDWPFPIGSLARSVREPDGAHAAATFRAEKQNLEGDGKRSIEIKPDYPYTLLPLGRAPLARVALPELSYLCEHALRWVGMPQGAAQQTAELAALAQVADGGGLLAVARALPMAEARKQAWRAFAGARKQGHTYILSTNGLGLVNIAAYLVEKADALARRSQTPVALLVDQAGACGGILPGLMLELGRRKLVAIAAMRDRSQASGAFEWSIVAALPSNKDIAPADLLIIRSRGPARAMLEIADGVDPAPASFFQRPELDLPASLSETCWLWLAKSGRAIAEVRSAVASRAATGRDTDWVERCDFKPGAALAALVARAERNGLDLPVSGLAPIVAAADEVLLASSEEGTAGGGKTASWGGGQHVAFAR